MKANLNPFAESWGGDAEREKEWTGDVPKYKGLMQCSCSS
jgi:hypothetical protein